MHLPVLVIKFGTAVITREGVIAPDIVKKIATEVAALSARYRIVLVSSGAVGSGKAYIKSYREPSRNAKPRLP